MGIREMRQIRAIDEQHDSRRIGNLQSNQPARLSDGNYMAGPRKRSTSNLAMTAKRSLRSLGHVFSPTVTREPYSVGGCGLHPEGERTVKLLLFLVLSVI